MLNNCTFQGRLGHDPELKEYTGPNGQSTMVTFNIAVPRPFGDETDWIRCVMFGKRAEVIDKYFSKGSMIIVQGRMESYKSKDGTKTYWNLKVDDFHFCESKKSEEAPEGFSEVDDDEDFALF